MIVDAVVPAWNEERSVAGVVQVLVASGAFRRVIVVDDGSRDRTASVASAAGAWVLSQPNSGKGGALRAGISVSDAGAIAFFDADLVGLRDYHPRELVEPVVAGRAGMCVGLRDYGPAWNKMQTALPAITGERCVRREVLDAVPDDFWRGWRIEAGMNEACVRLRANVESVVLAGVTMMPKWTKIGVKKGIEDGVKMLADVLVAIRDAKAAP